MKIINYAEAENKTELVRELLETEFCARALDEERLLEKFGRSCPGRLPQYLFLYDDNRLTGYFLLIGKENTDEEFPWLAATNADSLLPDEAELLYSSAIRLCHDLNEQELASQLAEDFQLTGIKNGSPGINGKVNQFFTDHFYPTPADEQMPSLRGAKSGWSFRFSKGEKDTLLVVLMLIVLILLVIGTVHTMLAG
ncbi:MAG: hypothetical protein Q4D59_08785 [Erysipelotrichaceae bacterium]|nr:hypothetical protein [Erysipelotrichaceae bacterium]